LGFGRGKNVQENRCAKHSVSAPNSSALEWGLEPSSRHRLVPSVPYCAPSVHSQANADALVEEKHHEPQADRQIDELSAPCAIPETTTKLCFRSNAGKWWIWVDIFV
jgi:hypothetical protein